MAATRRAKSQKLCELAGGKRVVFLTEQGIKTSNSGKPMHPRNLSAHVTRGELRRIRKALREQGRMDLLNQTLGR